MSPTLSILICTINDRIKDVPGMLLEEREDVTYIISFQYTDNMFLDMVPDVLRTRRDVEFIAHPTVGLSRNRNTALGACRTALALIADDDTHYTNEQIDTIIRVFNENPSVDVACFQAVYEDGTPLKTYPNYDFSYRQTPRGYYYSSIELALRTDTQLPLFDTRFGLGAPYLCCGEEEVFLYHAQCAGLNVHYFPYITASTRHGVTTGQRFSTDTRVRRSKGAVFYVIYGLFGGYLRICKTALLQKHNRWQAYRDMMDGLKYILRTE